MYSVKAKEGWSRAFDSVVVRDDKVEMRCGDTLKTFNFLRTDAGYVFLSETGEVFSIAVAALGKQQTQQELWQAQSAATQVELRVSKAKRSVRTSDAPEAASGEHEVRAPMPGRVIDVSVEVGQDVSVGQGLVVLEAMKMENEIRARRGGKLTKLLIKQGDNVELDQLLLVLE